MPSIFDTINLAELPPPEVIETPEFEALLVETLTQFQNILPQYQLLLESDPVVKVLEAFVYREMVMRNRINDVAKRNLLAFAEGGDLDHLAAFYQIARLVVTPATGKDPAVMETDTAFRYRIQQRILGWSNAGGKAHYAYFAMSADPRVREVSVYSPDYSGVIKLGGKVEIAVLSSIGNLVPTPDIIQAVKNMVGRNDVRMLTDLVEVVPATPVTFNVEANVMLLPNTSPSRMTDVEANFRAEFAKIQSLGRDITKSWIASVLQIDGVHSVEVVQPVASLTIQPNYFPQLGTLTLTFKGYGDSEGYGVGESDADRTLRAVNSFYINFAVTNKRTKEQIMADLTEAPKPGVIQPTVRGIAKFLNITNVYQQDGVTYLPEEQIVYLIWYELQKKQYAT